MREKIAEYLNTQFGHWQWDELDKLAKDTYWFKYSDAIRTLIDSSPTEWGEVVRKCQICDGCCNVMIEHGGIQHPTGCYSCYGTGEIVRTLSRGEALEWAKQIAMTALTRSMSTDWAMMMLSDGFRVRLKKEKI